MRQITVNNLIKSIAKKISDVSACPEHEAKVILAYIIGCNIAIVSLCSCEALGKTKISQIDKIVKRRASGEPLQYILGTAFFYGKDFNVGPGVLIPRPETEMLVLKTLEWLNTNHDKHDGPAKIIDMCTGCGNIAVTLATEYPNCQVLASDISEHAMIYGRRNINEFHVQGKVQLIKSDMGKQIAKQHRELMGKVDVLVSNPPYIPKSVYKKMPKEVVKYEPKEALVSGNDGYDHFVEIAEFAKLALRKGGLLAVELHEECLDGAAYILKAAEYNNINIVKDLANKPRIVMAIA